MQISILIFKIVMAFLSLSIATDAMKKVSELRVLSIKDGAICSITSQ